VILAARIGQPARPALPGEFHLADDLLCQLVDGFLLGGDEGLAAFGDEVGLLAEIDEERRRGDAVGAHDEVAAAVNPTGLNEKVRFDIAGLAEAIVGEDAFAIGDEPHGENAVG